jgi:hypothetical protein
LRAGHPAGLLDILGVELGDEAIDVHCFQMIAEPFE